MATGRQPAPRKSTGATQRKVPVAEKKNNLPLILGGVGGGVVLLVILVVAMSGGGGEPRPTKPKETVEKEPPKKTVDVSALESEGKSKCESGMKKCDDNAPKLGSVSGEQKDKLRLDIETGLKQINEGLAAYEKAAKLAGKKYDLGPYERTKSAALTVWSRDIEKEGLASCEDAFKVVQSMQSLMEKAVQDLSDAEKKTLTESLDKAKKQHEHGMGLCDRSNTLTGRGFDVTKYGSAYKALKMKLAELR